MQNCLRLEFVAEHGPEGPKVPDGAGGGGLMQKRRAGKAPVEAEECCAQRRALPVRRGAPAYVGWYEHPDFGRMRLRLAVECVDGQWGGEWEFGGHPGPRERVLIDLPDDRSLTIRGSTGRQRTELRGHVAVNGSLAGEVVHEGVGGGRFKLWPMEREQAAQRVQGWYVALCSGRCVDVPIHESTKDLPPECSICLQGFIPGDLISRTPCSRTGHVFHSGCAQEWLKLHSTCPLCRSPLLWSASKDADRRLLTAMAGLQWFSSF